MSRVPGRALLGFAILAAAMVTGCATLLPAGYAEGVRVHVHNESRGPVDVTASVNGKALDLGRIRPDHYPFFDLEIPVGRGEAEMVVAASSQSDEACRTDTIVLMRGSVLNMRLERVGHRSRWWVR